jgi:hypothetical protein
MLLVRRAAGEGHLLARAAVALAGLFTLCSGALAAWFSTIGFASLGPDGLKTMVTLHGVVNALGFVGLGLLGLRLLPPDSRAADGGAT